MALPRSSLVRRTIFVAGAASLLGPSVSHAQPITLSVAVRAAQTRDRSIQVAELERSKAVHEVGVARTRRYPIFSLTTLASQPLTPTSASRC